MGGLNLSNTSTKNMDWRLGGYIGALYDIHIKGAFYVQPQLIYSYEENKAKGESTGAAFCSQHSISIPILASYKIHFTDDIGMRINAGPYLQYSIFGREKTVALKNEQILPELGWWHHEFGEKLTYGVKAGIMIEKGKLFLDINGKYSLKKSLLNFDGHGTSLCIGIGYKF